MRVALFPLLALTAAGCTDTVGKYPSLLPRPIESQGIAEPETVTVVATPDPALDKQIAEVVAKVDAGQRSFAGAAQDAEAKIAVARGLPVGSEGWLDAQSGLSGLGSARQPVTDALIELEQMASARGQAGQPPYPALDAAIAGAAKIDQDQEARLKMLESALTTP